LANSCWANFSGKPELRSSISNPWEVDLTNVSCKEQELLDLSTFLHGEPQKLSPMGFYRKILAKHLCTSVRRNSPEGYHLYVGKYALW